MSDGTAEGRVALEAVPFRYPGAGRDTFALPGLGLGPVSPPCRFTLQEWGVRAPVLIMPAIWKRPATIELLTERSKGTAVQHLGIEFLEIGDDFIRARVPVDARTCQPYGLLHGGVSVVLAETLGSCGAACATPSHTRVVGLEVNANHLRGTDTGWVTGSARPIHLGRTTHVWQVEMHDDAGRPTCISRITMAILAPSGGSSESA